MAVRIFKWAKKLDYPKHFDEVPATEINGIGPKNFGWLVDDFICGVNIRESGRIHDADWYLQNPISESNRRFLKNMMIQIKDEPNFSKRQGARLMAHSYYAAVSVGWLFFY